MTAPAPLDLPALLDDLERAHAAATPGPWVVPLPFTKLIDGLEMQIASAETNANAALIVAAVNAVPTLIAELRKRDAVLRAVRAVLAAYDTGIPAPIPPAELRAALSPESVSS